MQTFAMLSDHATVPSALDTPQLAIIRGDNGCRAWRAVNQRQFPERTSITITSHLDIIYRFVHEIRVIFILRHTDSDRQLPTFHDVELRPPFALLDDHIHRLEITRFEDIDNLHQLIFCIGFKQHILLDGIVYQLSDVLPLWNILLDVIVNVLPVVDGIPCSLLDFVGKLLRILFRLCLFVVVHEVANAFEFLARVFDGIDVVAGERFVGEDGLHESNRILIIIRALAIDFLGGLHGQLYSE
mmetsp:Transcript_12686/g.27553  ORF Transcript_12686/g.27553 Transcript_12686/m.27553 type:complete len:242 (+) Transcript_12686:1645-2370(+)